MAKSKSILSLRGTFDGITFVNSRTYGKHIRAARGTHKKAEVNEAFQTESAKLLSTNLPAKILKDAIDLHRPDLRGGLLWQRLISIFRKQLKKYGSFDFSKLEPFEVHENYPFDRFLFIQPETHVNKKERVLKVGLHYPYHPEFKKSSFIDGYRLGLIGIFPDLKKQKAKTTVVYTKVIGLKEKLTPLTLVLPIPPKAKSFVLCVKIDGCMKGVVNGSPATKGMKVVGGGEV